jgi:hypothetical protein
MIKKKIWPDLSKILSFRFRILSYFNLKNLFAMKKTYSPFGIYAILLILFTNIILINNVHAQVTQEWVKFYERHTPNMFLGPFLAADKDGNSYVLGNDVINDSAYLVIIKYNTAGVQQWLKLYSYPNEPYYEPKGIVLDTSGNAYIVLNYGQDPFSGMNILTVKLNSTSGSVMWERKFVGQYGASTPKDIKIDKQNNIFITGWADSSLICIKYNSQTGDSLWVRKYKPLGVVTTGNSCTIDDSLNVIVTGYKALCIPYPPPGGCFDTMLTVKYNKDGVFRWAKTYFNPNRPGFDEGLKIINDQDGNSYIMGVTVNNTYCNIFLNLKYNRNGILQWASFYDGPGPDYDFIKSIGIDELHYYTYITGQINISGSTQYENVLIKYNSLIGDTIWIKRNSNIGAQDMRVDNIGNVYLTGAGSGVKTMKYNTEGVINWETVYSGFARGDNLEIDDAKNIYVCGSYTSSNYITLKYSQIEGIRITNNKLPSKFTLYQNYPNPFNPNTKIKFSISKRANIQLKIYDVLGRLKEVLIDKQLAPSEYEVTFKSENYSSGIYFYQLIADGNIIDTKKLSVIK